MRFYVQKIPLAKVKDLWMNSNTKHTTYFCKYLPLKIDRKWNVAFVIPDVFVYLFLNILVNLIMRNKTRSRWQLKHLQFHSHMIMMSLTPLDKCAINSSKDGLPAEQIYCLKFQHNWTYNFFKVTPVDANLGFLQDQAWSTLLQWLMVFLILPRRCYCCPSLVFVATRTFLKMSLFTGSYSFAKFEFLYRASSYNVNELLRSRMQL